ncbi:sulfatase family protein [Persicitalea jodogahamensis]|uniref:Heparan N-sulfatase n=1 Tax=Persicitalea jodogahamensis TaxID=402147 RepID=A0A8J3D847_9BACT|nr:sulfatase [Persicitalea jodogahamensis]GHB65689.1 heparan N-sulfatase [Persicitalea jodogahamensis]
MLYPTKPAFRFLLLLSIAFVFSCKNTPQKSSETADGNTKKPNILFVISDDQSYPHTSAYGYKAVSTPAFDRVAREGILFNNAFSASPGCSPSRAAILTGKNCWQVREAGTHASTFPADLTTYPEILARAGYLVGSTNKGWGPGKVVGREDNPAGKAYNSRKLESPKEMSDNDYASNFEEFLAARSGDQPFCFWFGAAEPHRRYPTGIGVKTGLKPDQVKVPGFLPDVPEVRTDMLDYIYEIQWYDSHLDRMLKSLAAKGELENTLVVVTSDNGMPFPRAKANCYEYGIHMPLAIMWGNKIKGGRTVDDLVSLIDMAPTFLQAAGVDAPETIGMAGKNLMTILTSDKSGLIDKSRQAVFSSRERHSSSRWNNLGYPQRAMRTADYLYIWNVQPERWPAGDPQKFEDDGKLGPMHGGYHDIDDFDESVLNTRRDDPAISRYFHLAVDKRPEVELYDIKKDPYCLNNLAGESAYRATREKLGNQLMAYLKKTNDPRMSPEGEKTYESYIRYSPIRTFPEPK